MDDVDRDVVAVVRKYHRIVYGKSLDADVNVAICAEEEDGFEPLLTCLERETAAAEKAVKAIGARWIATSDCGETLENAYRAYVITLPKMLNARIAWLVDRKSQLEPLLQDQSLYEAAESRAIDLDWPNDEGRMQVKDGMPVQGTPRGLDADGSITPDFAAVGGTKFTDANTHNFSSVSCMSALPICEGVDDCNEFEIAKKIGARPPEKSKPERPEDRSCTAEEIAIARATSKALDEQSDVPERQILKQLGKRFNMPWRQVRDISKKAMWHCGVK